MQNLLPNRNVRFLEAGEKQMFYCTLFPVILLLLLLMFLLLFNIVFYCR